MTNMPTEHQFKAFGITLGTVCVPFFLLIGSLNTNAGMEFWRDKWHRILYWMFGRPVPSEEEEEMVNGRKTSFSKPKRGLSSMEAKNARRIREDQIKPIARKRTMAPLDTSYQGSPLESNSKSINMSATRLHRTTDQVTLHLKTDKVSQNETEHRLPWWKKLSRKIYTDPDDLNRENV
jgi:hypothetical protein